MQDEVKIGQEVLFALSVSYDKNINILFPDSTYDFGTFEYNSRTYFTTKTDTLYSYDSVVYRLSTFEIDSVQFLQLPLFILKDEDSLTVLSTLDSVQLVHVVTEIPETPELRANTSYIEINRQFNYPYFLIGVGSLSLVGLVLVLLFGRQIRRWWQVYRLNRTHRKFMERFFNLMRDVSSNNPQKNPEFVLAFWKRYLERLERKPISKLTTKEILVLHNSSELKENLRAIDRNIYGGERGADLFASFDYLMKYTSGIFHQRINEIKNS